MKISLFLHGTIIMHLSGESQSREIRVQQSKRRDPEVLDYSSYIPIGSAVAKIKTWYSQGAEIVYLSSHRRNKDVEKDQFVLRKYGFPEGHVYSRRWWQSYSKVAEKIMPDIFIEDDCESIGGKREMTYPHINSKFQKRIKSIVIKEFSGIDHLPDDITVLQS